VRYAKREEDFYLLLATSSYENLQYKNITMNPHVNDKPKKKMCYLDYVKEQIEKGEIKQDYETIERKNKAGKKHNGIGI
jgi:hypothetical protein